MKVGIIGLGYWGPNLVRNFQSNPNINSVIGFDLNRERLKSIKMKFPELDLTDNYDYLLSNVDAVAIATPVNTHYQLARKALEAYKHVWLEKPFTAKVSQAEALIEIAEDNELSLFVDHTFIYTGAVRKIKELIDKNDLGDIIYFDSVRINLGLFQNDVNVIWDLAPHDLSIMRYLLHSKKISAVSADGIANYNYKENLAHLSCHFKENNCFAHFHVNWTSPVKIRRMMIAGKKKMLIYDDMENFEKIKVYDCGVELHNTEDLHEAKVQYRIGDMYSPKVNQTEALALGVKEFIDSILEKREPLTNGKDGREVVRILEAAEESIKNKGRIIEFRDEPINYLYAGINEVSNES